MDEGGGLENRCAARHRGFESLPLRQPIKAEALDPIAAPRKVPHMFGLGLQEIFALLLIGVLLLGPIVLVIVIWEWLKRRK